MRKRSLSGQLFRLFGLLIVPFTFLLIWLAKKSPETVESVYSLKLYPVIRTGISYLTRFLPFSVAEFFIYFLIVLLAVVFIVRLIGLIFGKHSFIKLLSFVISLLTGAAFLFFLFYLMWGFNYFRTPLAKRLDLPERTYTDEELYSVCLDLSAKASELRETVPVDTSGIFCINLNEMKSDVVKAYSDYGERRPSFKTDVPQAKPIGASEFFSERGISGIYIFLTAEPNINVNEPFLYMPFSAAHETAHYVGYAREEEANFLAFLVLRESGSAALSYSAYMHALANCSSALADSDRELYESLRATYSEGMLADLENYAEHYRRYAGTEVWKRAEARNDSYLKFNDQEKGTQSYREDVQLILRFYDSLGFFR